MGHPGRWNLQQWEARAEWVANGLDPRTACAAYWCVGIEYGDQRDVNEHLCWFHPRLGTVDGWVAENFVMREVWPSFHGEWHLLLTAAFERTSALRAAALTGAAGPTREAGP